MKTQVNKKRICFICDTPIQLMNCINILKNEFDRDMYVKDLYLGHIFRNSKNILLNLNKLNIFDNIFNFADISMVRHSVYERVVSLIHPSSILKKYNLDNNFNIFKYDLVFINMISYYTRTVILALDYNQICIYEDGIGSYDSNLFDLGDMPIIVRILNRTILHNKLKLDPLKVYINHSKYYNNVFNDKIVEMHKLNEKNKAMDDIIKVFDTNDDNQYINKPIVYFTTPIEEIEVVDKFGIENKILDFFDEFYSQNYIIRIHPRKDIDKYYGYEFDNSERLWELICRDSINNENILVSFYSTALFMPAILYDKKPYIIFLYKLYDGNRYNKKMDKMIKFLKTIYEKDYGKIRVPTSLKEFITDIRNIQG